MKPEFLTTAPEAKKLWNNIRVAKVSTCQLRKVWPAQLSPRKSKDFEEQIQFYYEQITKETLENILPEKGKQPWNA